MPLFHRTSLYHRGQTLDVSQPIQSIEINPEGIGLLVKGNWLRCRWNEIHDAILLRKEVFMHSSPPFFRATYHFRTPDEAIALMEQRRTEHDERARRLRRMGISTREILFFNAFDRVWKINLSSAGSHFEKNELLRSILLAELHPTVKTRMIYASPLLWMMSIMLILIILTFASQK